MKCAVETSLTLTARWCLKILWTQKHYFCSICKHSIADIESVRLTARITVSKITGTTSFLMSHIRTNTEQNGAFYYWNHFSNEWYVTCNDFSLSTCTNCTCSYTIYSWQSTVIPLTHPLSLSTNIPGLKKEFTQPWDGRSESKCSATAIYV